MTTLNRFRLDNTEGYAPEQLAELNLRFVAKSEPLLRANTSPIAEAPSWWIESQLDRIAEQVQADYDNSIEQDLATLFESTGYDPDATTSLPLTPCQAQRVAEGYRSLEVKATFDANGNRLVHGSVYMDSPTGLRVSVDPLGSVRRMPAGHC